MSDFMVVLLWCSLMICLAAAGFWDVKARRIPNRWIYLWYFFGFGVYACSGWLAALGYLVRSAVAVGLLFLLFLCRMMGAGDVKCIALICGYLGFSDGALVAASGMMIGALWSLGKLIHGNLAGERMGYLLAYFRRVFQERRITAYYVPERDGREVTVPLALCLLLGLIYVIFLKCR